MDFETLLNDSLFNPGRAGEVLDREVPMLAVDWGVRDEDAMVHTLGVNFLAAIGRSVGLIGLTEYPVPRAERWKDKLVRVDAAWIDRANRHPRLLAEFERFSTGETLVEKQANLYVAAHGCDESPEVLLLCAWALDGVPVDVGWHPADRPIHVSGRPSVTRPPRSRIVVAQAVFGRRGDMLHFLRFRRLA